MLNAAMGYNDSAFIPKEINDLKCGILLLSKTGIIIYQNDCFVRLLALEDEYEDTFTNYIYHDDQALFQSQLEVVWGDTLKNKELILRLEGQGSQQVWVKLLIKYIEHQNGQGLFFIIVQPIEEIQASAKHQITMILDPKGKINEIQGNVLGILGYTENELINSNLYQFIANEAASKNETDTNQAISKDKSILFLGDAIKDKLRIHRFKHYFISKNGEYFPVISSLIPCLDQLDNHVGFTFSMEFIELNLSLVNIEAIKFMLEEARKEADICLWVLDKDFNLVESNQAWVRNLEEVLGCKVSLPVRIMQLDVPSSLKFKWMRRYLQAMQGKSIESVDHIYTNTGQEKVFKVRCGPLVKNGQVIGFKSFAKEITGQFQSNLKLKEREQKLAYLNQEVIDKNNNFQEYTYIISHKLRAPVANLLGLVNLYDKKEPLNPRNTVLIDHIQNAVIDLDEIARDLNALLQVTQNISEKKDWVRFEQAAKKAVEGMNEQMEKTEASLKYDFSAVEQIYTIPSYLESILQHTLSNAIKYCSADRKPFIELSTKDLGDKILLSIKDNGLGIDLDKYGEHLFNLYARFHHHVDGKGIGLYLIKSQVETLGGYVEVESEVNQFTHFKIYFFKPTLPMDFIAK